MEKYRSIYPTLRQAKTKWSKPTIVAKQGEGPSHDWYEMMRKDAKAKLASSIHQSKYGSMSHQTKIVHEEADGEEHLYHVTHTKHVGKIQKQGLRPMQTSNWVKAGDKQRYGKGEVYTFTHKDDAHAWAGRMDWAHHQKLGSGNISIVTVKKPKDHQFDVDDNDPLSQAGQKGKWLKTHKPIEPHHIVSVEKYAPKKLGEDKVSVFGFETQLQNVRRKETGVKKRKNRMTKDPRPTDFSRPSLKEEDRIGKQTPSAESIAKKHNKEVAEIQAQIDKGIKVEREHTDSDAEAHEIARDHLDEFPDYYDRLDKMEKQAKKDMKEEKVKKDKPKPTVMMIKGTLGKAREVSKLHAELLKKQGWKVVKEEFITEDKGEGNVSNTRGVLHELLTGYHLRGGSHMEKHKDVHGDSPKQAHDKLKAKVSPDEYKAINHRAKAAAAHIAERVSKHGKLHDVHWTSKTGDIHRSTGIHATQDQDQSDIVVHTKHPKTGKIMHHGYSLKVTDSKAHVPVSNLGITHTPGAAEHLEKHRKAVFAKHPALGKMTSSDERKKYVREHPKVRDSIRSMNSETLSKVTKTAAKHLSSLPTAKIADHVRHHILRANPTPMQQQGHTHTRHTTHGAAGGKYTFSSVDPSKDHEHILQNHKHITVHASGTSVIFSHKGTPFARHRIKFTSQSDPKSTFKGSGEMIGKSAIRSVNENASNYDPEKEQLRSRIEAHKNVAAKMAERHGEQSVEAAFHRALVKRYEKELGEDHLHEDSVPNSVGGGNIAGMPTHDAPELTPINKTQMLRRKKFAGKQVFVVDPTTYHKAYLGKRKYEHYEKYLEGSPFADEIRAYGRTYWDEPIILENEQTGAMVYLKYGSK